MKRTTCDPAAAGVGTFWSEEIQKGGGAIIFNVRYGWDGVSTVPDCVGPIQRLRVANTSAESWYAHLPRTVLGPMVYTIEPGANRTITSRPALDAIGLSNNTDLYELVVNKDPTVFLA